MLSHWGKVMQTGQSTDTTESMETCGEKHCQLRMMHTSNQEELQQKWKNMTFFYEKICKFKKIFVTL